MKRNATLVQLAGSLLMGGGVPVQEAVKIGLIMPLTGPFTPTGPQINMAMRQ